LIPGFPFTLFHSPPTVPTTFKNFEHPLSHSFFCSFFSRTSKRNPPLKKTTPRSILSFTRGFYCTLSYYFSLPFLEGMSEKFLVTYRGLLISLPPFTKVPPALIPPSPDNAFKDPFIQPLGMTEPVSSPLKSLSTPPPHFQPDCVFPS